MHPVCCVGHFTAAWQHSVAGALCFGTIRMLDLDSLIPSNEAAGREKDKSAWPLLRALAERQKQTPKA